MPALIVDSDGASDDAAALLWAASSPDLVAVTVTGGVVPVEQAVHNVLVVLHEAGRDDVPVFAGAARSLLGRPFEGAPEVHGDGGLGGHRFAAPAGRSAGAEPAADALCRLAGSGDAEAPVTVVMLGPMTNLAVALARDPALSRRAVRVIAMAGAQDAVGNVSAVAEYNVWCDPEAAAAILTSGLDVTLVGWDVSRRDAVIGDRERRMLAEVGTSQAAFLLRVNEALDRFCREEQGLSGYDLPDAAAVAVALDPSVVTRLSRHVVGVETSGRLTRGMTVVDHRRGGSPNATVVWSIDHDRFVRGLAGAVAAPSGAGA